MTESNPLTLESLFEERRAALRAFFRRRSVRPEDLADVMQEVYLRMLRVKDVELINNPEAYLFTVAGNLLKERAVLAQRAAVSVEHDAPEIAVELAELPQFDRDLDSELRHRRLREVLKQLPLKCQAVVSLYFQRGMTYQQVGEQLGISSNMVKKYLAQALAHCRKRMGSLG